MLTADAAKLLGIQPRSVNYLIRKGLLTAQKIGRDYHIEAAEVERYARERRAPGWAGKWQENKAGCCKKCC